MRTGRAASAAVMLAVLATLAGCGGGGEEQFTAQSFIDAANSHGAGLTLGSKLFSGKENVDVYGVSLQGADAPGNRVQEAETGASLSVAPDGQAALAVYRQCEQTGTFVCFRAANATLVFESLAKQADLDRITEAIRSMASK